MTRLCGRQEVRDSYRAHRRSSRLDKSCNGHSTPEHALRSPRLSELHPSHSWHNHAVSFPRRTPVAWSRCERISPGSTGILSLVSDARRTSNNASARRRQIVLSCYERTSARRASAFRTLCSSGKRATTTRLNLAEEACAEPAFAERQSLHCPRCSSSPATAFFRQQARSAAALRCTASARPCEALSACGSTSMLARADART